MKDLTTYVKENQQINESMLLILACLVTAPVLSHFISKTINFSGHTLDSFWDWTFDGKNNWEL